MIAELLGVGAENAKTSKELTAIIGCDRRQLTAAIERERRAGKAICASTGEHPGYYIAADDDELESYCKSLQHRAGELTATRLALLEVLMNYAEKRQRG